jgi:hypothetical protein
MKRSSNGKPGKQSKFVVLPKAAIDRLLKHERAADLIALYTFYNYTGTWQKTNQPKAAIAYVAKGLHWGRDKVRFIKSLLFGMELIEDVTRRNTRSGKTEGWFVKIKHFAKLKNHPTDQPEGGLNQRVVSKATNACSSGKLNTCSSGKRNACSSGNTHSSNAPHRFAALRDGVCFEREEFVSEEHREAIHYFNAQLVRLGWLPVTRISEELERAFEKFNAYDIRRLVDAVVANSPDVIPKRKTLVRLLWSNY